MKIGVLGLGNIAEKAYLPVISSNEDIELVFCTRNFKRLKYFAEKYRVTNTATSVEELIKYDLDAVFVHAATKAHPELLKKLLEHDLHIYVDKPISNSLAETREIINLAAEKKLKLMVGFNRRYVPFYQKLQKLKGKKLILIEKNRMESPAPIRQVVYDDFIHLIDTARFLLNSPVEEVSVDAIIKDDLLEQLVVKLRSGDITSINIMNRISGINEEKAEVIADNRKLVVNNLIEMKDYSQGIEQKSQAGRWDPMLYNRGFVGIVDYFLKVIQKDIDISHLTEDAFKSHELCERVINKILF